MTKNFINISLTCLMLSMLVSCDNPLEREKLDLTTIENDEILVEKYRISRITTIHQFIDMTNIRWNETERILEANDGSIDSVFIKKDTLFLQKSSGDPIIYDLAAIKSGYK